MEIKELNGHKTRPDNKIFPVQHSAFLSVLIRVHPWFDLYFPSYFDFTPGIA
jgi:hypothetical protein